MNQSNKISRSVRFALLIIAANTADAAPPDVVTSDVSFNTAMGSGALGSVTNGMQNTATGYESMSSNSTGNANTAYGSQSLDANTTGTNNTAVGNLAMQFNLTGNENTAVGEEALSFNGHGNQNTAVGWLAMRSSNGDFNTGVGAAALGANGNGTHNTALGASALENSSADYDTAVGSQALVSNSAGYRNTADGWLALTLNTTGNRNTAAGTAALHSNVTGSNNIAIGDNAGYALDSDNNIDIGNYGTAHDTGVIRIGTPSTHLATYIAGISSAHITGAPVYITSSGQLGVLASAERYKTAIAPIGMSSARLRDLRPVTFHLKTDPPGAVQYGLIAEEVARVYPELVIRDQAGKLEGVRYDELAPMLLNEAQRQQESIAAQQEQLHDVQRQLTKIRQLMKSQAAAAGTAG